jgi:hypothetical protein
MISAICELSGLHPDVVTEDVQRTIAEFEHLGIVRWEP